MSNSNNSSSMFPSPPFPEPGKFKPHRPQPSRNYIKPKERVIAADYDLWDKLRPVITGRRPFEGFLEPEVPAGRYACRPLFGGLVKLKDEDDEYIPHRYLILAVAAGPHTGKVIAKYWPYNGDPGGIFARDCKDMGLHMDWLDNGCEFSSGGVLVRVTPVNPDCKKPVEVSYLASLVNLIPEEIWPTAEDKPSAKKSRALEKKLAIAAAESLDVDENGHEQEESSQDGKPPA